MHACDQLKSLVNSWKLWVGPSSIGSSRIRRLSKWTTRISWQVSNPASYDGDRISPYCPENDRNNLQTRNTEHHIYKQWKPSLQGPPEPRLVVVLHFAVSGEFHVCPSSFPKTDTDGAHTNQRQFEPWSCWRSWTESPAEWAGCNYGVLAPELRSSPTKDSISLLLPHEEYIYIY